MKHRLAGLIFVAAVCHQLFYLHFLPLSLSIDSYGYMTYAAHLLSPDTPVVRTPGYPAIVAALGVHWLDSLVPLVVFQMLVVATVPPLCFYALLPAGYAAAWVGSVLSLLYAYPITMTQQVMTESTYMTGLLGALLLFAVYCIRRRLPWLLAAFAVAMITVEIRPSANILYVCITAGVVLLALKERTRGLFIHTAIAVILSVTAVTGRSLVTDRNSANITPFFIYHWLSQCRLVGDSGVTFNPSAPNSSSCISLETGPATRAFFDAVREMLNVREDVYVSMASGHDFRGAQTGVRPEFQPRSPETIERLLQDLATNTSENAHRAPAMVMALWRQTGVGPGGALLRAMVFETLLAHPQVLLQKAPPLIKSLTFASELLRFNLVENHNALNENVYWQFVPKSLTEYPVLDAYPGGPSAFAQWIFGLDQLTGRDPEAKLLSGRYPGEWRTTVDMFRQYDNYTIMAVHIGNWLTRMQTETLVWLSLVAIIPAFLTPLWPVAVAAFLAAWGLTVSSFVVQDNYRQIVLHVMPLILVTGLGLQGTVNWRRRRRETERGALTPAP